MFLKAVSSVEDMLLCLSLHQYVSHSLDVFFSIIRKESTIRLVSTRATVSRLSPCTKPDSWIRAVTVNLFVTQDANSCLRKCTPSIEPFFRTVGLQRRIWTNQRLPRVTTQWDVTVLPVSYQWVQGIGGLVDDNEINLLVDLHSKTDLGEGSAPVGRQLGLLWVKPSHASFKIMAGLVAPKVRIIVEGSLGKISMKGHR